MACTGGNCSQDAAKKKGCKCVCECLPKKKVEVPGDSPPGFGSNAPVGIGGDGPSQTGVPGGPSNPGSGIIPGGGGPGVAIGIGHGSTSILGPGLPQSGQWVPFQGGILPTPMPEVELMPMGGGARGHLDSASRPGPQRPIRGDLPVLKPLPPLLSPVPDGLQAQATLAPPPGYSFGSSGIAQAANLPSPLVAPAYALRHHRALEFPKPLPVAAPATGNFDLGGERRAANSGIGASEGPRTDDGYARAGVWKEWTQSILSPPIHDSQEPFDLTDARNALGVHAPPGAYLSPASVGVLEGDFLDEFTASPPDQPSSLALDQGAVAPSGKAADPSVLARIAAQGAPEGMEQRFPFTSRESGQSSGAALHGLDRAMQGGGLHVVPSIRPSVRPSVIQKPGSGKGGGIGGAMDTKERADEVANFVHENLLGGTVPYSDALGDAVAEGSTEAQKLYEEAAKQKEAASKNFSNPDQFKDRWDEEEKRRTHAKERTVQRYTTQYGAERGKSVMAADKNIVPSREARDTATGVKAATAGHKDFKNPAKAKEARAKAKEAQKKAKEARKAARDAKNAAKYGTQKQRDDAKEKADRLAAEAKVLASEAKRLLDEANKPPPPLKVEDCGDATGCGTCQPLCEDGQECVCHWEVPSPPADGGGGTDEGGKKGKGVKGSAQAPVAPDGTSKGVETTKDESKPKSPIEQLIADVEQSGLAKGNSSQARFVRRMLRALKAFGRKDAEIDKKMDALKEKAKRLSGNGEESGHLSGSDIYQLKESVTSVVAGQIAKAALSEMASIVTGYLQEGLSGSDRTRAVLAERTDRLQAKRDGVEEAGRKSAKGVINDLLKPKKKATSSFRMTPSDLKFHAEWQRKMEEDFLRAHPVPEYEPRPDADVGVEMAREQDRSLDEDLTSRELTKADASAQVEFKAQVAATLEAMEAERARFMAEPPVPGPSWNPPDWRKDLRKSTKQLSAYDQWLLEDFLFPGRRPRPPAELGVNKTPEPPPPKTLREMALRMNELDRGEREEIRLQGKRLKVPMDLSKMTRSGDTATVRLSGGLVLKVPLRNVVLGEMEGEAYLDASTDEVRQMMQSDAGGLRPLAQLFGFMRGDAGGVPDAVPQSGAPDANLYSALLREFREEETLDRQLALPISSLEQMRRNKYLSARAMGIPKEEALAGSTSNEGDLVLEGLVMNAAGAGLASMAKRLLPFARTLLGANPSRVLTQGADEGLAAVRGGTPLQPGEAGTLRPGVLPGEVSPPARPEFVYRGGPLTKTNVTPRLGNDTAGLSTYERLDQVWAEEYRKAVEFEVKRLREAGFEAVPDAATTGKVGHVSIRPADAKALEEWAKSRLLPEELGPVHEYTDALLKMGKVIKRPPQ